MNVCYRIPCESELGCQLLMWAQCRDIHFRYISLDRAKLLSFKELSNLNIRF